MKRIAAIIISLIILAVPCFSAYAVPQPIEPLESSRVKMMFVAWADPQVSNIFTSRRPYLISSAGDLKNNCAVQPDALVIAGDITENSLADEWQWVYDGINDIGVKNYIIATGNHDVRMHEYSDTLNSFCDFTNNLNEKAGSPLKIKRLHYSYSINGFRFIVLGSDSTMLEEADIHKKQLKWLDSELKEYAVDYKPVFVVVHQPIQFTHGLPGTWGSSSKTAGSIGAQSDEIKRILNKYGNVILITGHLHSGLGQYTYQKVGNVYSVNLPSLGVDNSNGSYNDNGTGYMVEVYKKKVVFRARNFDKGEYVSQYNIKINLYKANAVLSEKTYKYDGKRKTPGVKVTDAYGAKIPKRYYTVKYPRGRIKPGKYKVKIVFKGKFKSNKTVVKRFRIKR